MPRSSDTPSRRQASRTSRTGSSTRSCARIRSPRGSIDKGAKIRGLEPAAYIGIPAGAIDKTSGRDVKALYDFANRTLTEKFADGTLKALSMKYFAHDYATAAARIDPASFAQDIH